MNDSTTTKGPQPADFPAVLTIEEAAKLLRISRATAYRAARRGDFPCFRTGKTVRVSRDVLVGLLAQGQAPSRRETT